jgi:hypothetical protein
MFQKVPSLPIGSYYCSMSGHMITGKFYWSLIGSLDCSMMFRVIPRDSRGVYQVSFTVPCDFQGIPCDVTDVPWASMSFHGVLCLICDFPRVPKGRSCDLHECSMGFHGIPQYSIVP